MQKRCWNLEGKTRIKIYLVPRMRGRRRERGRKGKRRKDPGKMIKNIKKLLKELCSPVLINNLENYLHNHLQFFIFFYCCAGWGYIVAFTKVLTMYQIHHTCIHPPPTALLLSPLPLQFFNPL
jgi:hypothetical protein